MNDDPPDIPDDHSRQLLRDAADHGNTATQKYHDWVRQMLSLSFAALTALVALQKNYKPDTDLARYFLWATFVSLAASVVASAIVLRAEGLVVRDLSRQLATDALLPIEKRRSLHVGNPPRIAVIAKECLPWILSLSVLCLSAFAVINSA